MLSRAQSLLSLYAEMGVPKDKLIMRVPATWAGIQAAAELEKQGIATQAFHIYRCAR
jgi:transaldolase